MIGAMARGCGVFRDAPGSAETARNKRAESGAKFEDGAWKIPHAPSYFAPLAKIAGPILRESSFIVEAASHKINMYIEAQRTGKAGGVYDGA